MLILWLYQNLFWPNLVWHLTCHIIVKILESFLITVCVLWSWFPFVIVLCVCARARVCEGERVWVFFVCLFCMPCVEWVWMFLVLLFYVIYSRTIASIANVFCWLYPTLNKVYLILSYRLRVSLAQLAFCWWRHNRLLMTSQWADNCDAVTWIMISYSLNTDFIHGDIHGRSCTKFAGMCVSVWYSKHVFVNVTIPILRSKNED